MLIQHMRLNMMVNIYSPLLIYSDQCKTNFVIDVKYDIRKISASCNRYALQNTLVSLKTGGFLECFFFVVRKVGNKAARKLN